MGFPGSVLLSEEDVLTVSTTKVLPLGTRGYTRDGRVFRYTRNGTVALEAGKMVQSGAPIASELLVTSGTTKIRANSTYIKLMHNTTEVFTSANFYADGYLFAATSTTAKGRGHYCQIKSHTLSASTAVALVVSPYGQGFYSPTTNFGTTNVNIGVSRNPYDSVIVRPTANASAAVVGCTVRPVAASTTGMGNTKYYFWLQTWGPCCVDIQGGNLVAGRAVWISSGSSRTGNFRGTSLVASTLNSSLATKTGGRAAFVNQGILMTTSLTGTFGMVFLKFAP